MKYLHIYKITVYVYVEPYGFNQWKDKKFKNTFSKKLDQDF